MARFRSQLFKRRAALLARVVVLFLLLPFIPANAEHSPESLEDLIAPIVVPVSSHGPEWVFSPDVFLAGSTHRLIVTGTYEYQGSYQSSAMNTADAECFDLANTPEEGDTNLANSFDLEINKKPVEWIPLHRNDSNEKCAGDVSHAYYVDIAVAVPSGSVAGDPICDAVSGGDITSSEDNRYCFEAGRLRFGVNLANVNQPSGELYVYPVCQFFNHAYIVQGASNHPASETAEPAAGCPNGTGFTNARYPCPKGYHDDPIDTLRRYGILTGADLLIDSRTNELDPILKQDPHSRNYNSTTTYYANTATSTDTQYTEDELYKFRQSGHWGITTCNLAGVGIDYRITVGGTYKFDQTQPEGYAEADAECATGYPQSTATVNDHNNQPVTDTYRASRRSVVTEASENETKAVDDRKNETSIGLVRSFRSIAPQFVWDTVPSDVKAMVPQPPESANVIWTDQFIPSYYNYFFQLLRSNRLAGPQETRPWTDDALPATWDYTEFVYASHNQQAHVSVGDEFDPFSSPDENRRVPQSEWKPHRFEFLVTQTGAAGAPTVEAVDAFDLRLSYAGASEKYVDWKPLKKAENTSFQALTVEEAEATGGCSPIHAYYFDIDWEDVHRFVLVPNAPIHFKIQDVVAYNEWDNCGALSINVTTQDPSSKEFEINELQSDFDFGGGLICHEVPYTDATEIKIRDLRFDDRNAANLQTTHAYYFEPTSTVVSELVFKPDGDDAGKMISNSVTWENFGAGPHSITAAVDKDGGFCHGVVTYPTRALVPFATLTSVGADDCDRDVTRTSSDEGPSQGRGVTRLFDSHPRCLGDVFKTAEGSRLCTAPFERVSWQVQLSDAYKSSDMCTTINGKSFCNIPYFCRVAPELMRGNLVVRVDK